MSSAENIFVDNLIGGNESWIGASDDASEGVWIWIEGPENGDQFWSGGKNGSPVGGLYNNWGTEQPKSGDSENNHATMKSAGDWWNRKEGDTFDYVIEWEGSNILVTGSTTTLNGGDGLDTLYGDNGLDIFMFESANAFNDIDVINSFTTSDGDAIDISDLLTGYTAGTDDIIDWVQITDNGTDSTLAIDVNGTVGGSSYSTVATLLSVTGLTDEAQLETDGNLITA